MLTSGTNFRSSSRDFKQGSAKNLQNLQSTQTLKKGSQITKSQNNSSQIHVKKWVDYSTKYGLGYLLSDGSTGVYFNDSTKIIVDKNGENFEYIEKKPGERIDTICSYQMSDYPQER